MLVSHLNMNGITSLNYPKVAFESWSLPVPGRKTLGLTCWFCFIRFWNPNGNCYYYLLCFSEQLEVALFENKHVLFTKRLYSGKSIKLKYLGLMTGCILLFHIETSASCSLPQLWLDESKSGWDYWKFMALGSWLSNKLKGFCFRMSGEKLRNCRDLGVHWKCQVLIIFL